MDVTTATRVEREELIGLLETLTSEQWATPSLCEGWDVQAVAAHLAWASAFSVGEMVRELVRAGGRPNRLVARSAVRWSARGRPAILAQLRRDAVEDAKPLGMPRDAALLDAVVHGLDIRQPLGLAHDVPAEVFRRVADFAAGTRWPSSLLLGGQAARRLDGVRLVADGMDWATGEGAGVVATPDAALLVLTGRPARAAELSGPGAPVLVQRLGLR